MQPLGNEPVSSSSTWEEAAKRKAGMAWLEAVSVHAFARLERELAAHGAPRRLRRDARRARRDEVRHAGQMRRLAQRRGGVPRCPDKPAFAPVRPLARVALENGVEGCVRETYGALQDFVDGLASPDAEIRQALRRIGKDECRHAELAWAIHAWALPRLSQSERARVEGAMRDAVGEIARSDPRGVTVLSRLVWRFNAE
jgi:hypothetical protein